MKSSLTISILLSLIGAVSFAQSSKPTQAWKVVFASHLRPTPNAPEVVVKRTKKKNENLKSAKKIVLISDSLWHVTHSLNIAEGHKSKSNSIYNLKDSVVYQFNGKGYTRQSYASYLKTARKDLKKMKVTHVKYYPKSEKRILGYPVKKFTFDLEPKNEPVQMVMHCTMWCTKTIPYWHINEASPVKIPGYPLKKIVYIEKAITDPVRNISVAVKLERVSLKESDYFPPDDYKIIDKTKKQEK